MTVILLVVPVVALTAQQGSDPAAEALAESCVDEVARLVDGLQGYVDGFAGMSAQRYLLEPRDDADARLRTTLQARLTQLSDLGCEAELIDRRLRVELERLRGEGTIAVAVADALRASLLGTPQAQPGRIEVTPDDDLASLLVASPSGSTLVLGPGVHRVGEPLLVAHPIRIVGAGRDETRIVSTGEEAAMVLLETGALDLDELTLEHDAEVTVAVLLVHSPAYSLRDARVTGGTASAEGAGGTGVLVAPTHQQQFDGIEDSDGRWDATLHGIEVIGNDGPGIVVTGEDEPTITAATVEHNGACGVCFVGTGSGSIADSTVRSNGSGVVVGASASATVVGNVVADNATDGILVEEDAAPTFTDNDVVDNAGRGAVVLDRATPSFVGNRFADNGEAGIALGDASAPRLIGNELVGHEIGVWVEGGSRPTIDGNMFEGPGVVAVVIGAESVARVAGNSVRGYVLGIEAREQGRPELVDNVVTGAGEVAFVLRGDAEVTGSGNRCENSPVDVLLVERATSRLEGTGCRLHDER